MGFRLRNFVAALLILGTLTTGLIGFAGNIFDVYGSNGTDLSVLGSQANETFRQTNETIDRTQGEAGAIGGGIAEGLFILKSVWNVLSLTLSSIATATGFITTISFYLGIPAWFVSLITGIITVFVVYELVTLYRGIRS